MVTVAIVAGIGSMAAFLFLIDYTARLLRPTAICQRVAERGMAVIEAVYPDAIEHQCRMRGSGNRRPHPNQQGLSCTRAGPRGECTGAQRGSELIRFSPECPDGVIRDFDAAGSAISWHRRNRWSACLGAPRHSATARCEPRSPSARNAPSSRMRRLPSE